MVGPDTAKESLLYITYTSGSSNKKGSPSKGDDKHSQYPYIESVVQPEKRNKPQYNTNFSSLEIKAIKQKAPDW